MKTFAKANEAEISSEISSKIRSETIEIRLNSERKSQMIKINERFEMFFDVNVIFFIQAKRTKETDVALTK